MSRNRQQSRDTVAIPFRYFAVGSLAAQAIFVSPNGTFSPRLAAIADDFDEYRVTSLRFRLQQPITAAATFAACYQPGIIDTPPTTAATISEGLNSIVLSTGITTPSQWSRVPKGVLAGMHPWYKTIPGTPEASEELQGGIYAAASTTGSILEWEGVCEFRSAISAGNTPMERALAARRREKARIMGLLALDTTSSAAPRTGK